MSNSFSTLRLALKNEGLLQNPDKSRFLPELYYGTSLSDLGPWLADFLRRRAPGKRVCLVVDGTPKKSSAEPGREIDADFRAVLAGAGIAFDEINLSERLAIPSSEIHASAHLLERVRLTLAGCGDQAVVALGSGSLTDLVKHAMHLEGMKAPFISVPTALTVTAFTSAFAVLDFSGAKRTQVSREVTAACWIQPFLANAPGGMSRAGYGDLLARFVAYGDWFLGHRLGVMEHYDELAFRLMEPFAPDIRAHAAGFASEPLPEETTECAAAALAMAGIAMSVSGETTPLSGYEHVISHGLDFLRLTSGRELNFHGEQVALGSLISARTIDSLLTRDLPGKSRWRTAPVAESLATLETLISEAPFFGGEEDALGEKARAGRIAAMRDRIEAAREEFALEYRKKWTRWEAAASRLSSFIESWPDLRVDLSRLTVRAGELEPLLRKANLPVRPRDMAFPATEHELRWAIRFAPFVRLRMNVADLLFWMGEDPLNTSGWQAQGRRTGGKHPG
ncbi:MAG: iron-containing alcohol dehydrogenase [Syntrophales bacterium]|jgi:glycerol-1-phosphate dehydrogenase [NAD(P)+]|nr:iron-containing alcohol dehydrogenase [Syntrophales bacterium]